MIRRLTTLLTVGALLAACGGGGGGSSSVATGNLTVGFTDAPVDGVLSVVIFVTGVTLKPVGAEQQEITFASPLEIDLASLVGGVTATVLNREEVHAGNYEWIRFHVDAEFDGDTSDGYADLDTGARIEIEVPSDRLRLVSGFTVTANRTTSFIIDWDLRQALTDPVGQPGYFVKPAWRIIDETEHGTLLGTVANTLIDDASCTNDPATDTGNAVYVFAAGETPDDIDDVDDTSPTNIDPIVTANVKQDINGDYRYAVHFLEPGDYTIAFTCQALDDMPDADDPIAFVGTQDATILVDMETVADF